MENEGEVTLVADEADVERPSVTSWRLLLGRNLESGTCCVVGHLDKRACSVWHVESEECCWAERAGWDSCTGVGRSFSGSVEAEGREEEEEEEETDVVEESGAREHDIGLWVGGLWPVSMLLSLMSTVIPPCLLGSCLLSRISC